MMPSLFRLVPTIAPSVEDARDTPSRSSARTVSGNVARLLFAPAA